MDISLRHAARLLEKDAALAMEQASEILNAGLAMARSAAGRGNDALVSLRRATELNASAEKVRQPIFRDGVGRWRHYEPWLGPLKRPLGPVLERYPAVPTDTPSTIQQIVDQSQFWEQRKNHDS